MASNFKIGSQWPLPRHVRFNVYVKQFPCHVQSQQARVIELKITRLATSLKEHKHQTYVQKYPLLLSCMNR